MPDFHAAFADLLPQGAPIQPSAPVAPDFSAAFADLVPQQTSTMDKVGALAAAAVKPIIDIPSTAGQMAKDAVGQMGEGVGQIKRGTLSDVAQGVGKTALGALNYAGAWPNAALHTILGKPIEDATGIPSSWTELAASLALPIPKHITAPARAATVEKAAAPTADALRDAANDGYAAARDSGLSIKGDAIQSLSQRIQGDLSADGFRDYLAPKTYAALKEMAAAPKDGVAQAADIDGMRRVLGRAARDFSNPSEQEAAGRTISQLDNYMAAVPKVDIVAGDADAAASALKDARGNYAAAKRSELLTDKMERAERNAESANSGQNLDNAIRQQVKTIINNPKLRSGYSQAELAQMDQIIKGSAVGDISRTLGNVLGGGGGMHTFIAMGSGAGAGMAVHGPVGAAVGATLPAVGYAFKKLGSYLTTDQVAKLDEAIRSRSPLAQTVGAPMQDFGRAAQAYEVSPSARSLARATLASRNLAGTLASVGITVSPNDLLSPPASTPSEPGADRNP